MDGQKTMTGINSYIFNKQIKVKFRIYMYKK